jgi:hypothetical protein
MSSARNSPPTRDDAVPEIITPVGERAGAADAAVAAATGLAPGFSVAHFSCEISGVPKPFGK